MKVRIQPRRLGGEGDADGGWQELPTCDLDEGYLEQEEEEEVGLEQEEIDDSTERVVVDIRIPISQNALLAPMYTGDRQIVTTSSLTFESYDGYYDGSSS